MLGAIRSRSMLEQRLSPSRAMTSSCLCFKEPSFLHPASSCLMVFRFGLTSTHTHNMAPLSYGRTPTAPSRRARSCRSDSAKSSHTESREERRFRASLSTSFLYPGLSLAELPRGPRFRHGDLPPMICRFRTGTRHRQEKSTSRQTARGSDSSLRRPEESARRFCS